MARVGRGRSRGGRVLDVTEFPLRGMGRGKMIGRGTAAFDDKLKGDNNPNLKPEVCKPVDVEKEGKKTLEEQLRKFENVEDGCFVHITLDFFASSQDVEYYIDKVMDSLLKSSVMVERFTMCFKLITLLKEHGEKIKTKMFAKLQTVFTEMEPLMKASSDLNSMDRRKVRNFCELIGQLYFRFRVNLDSAFRYDVLSVPAIDCMCYLARVRGHLELLVAVKLIFLNYSALCEHHQEQLNKLSIHIRLGLVEEAEDTLERTWLLCALDIIKHSHELPQYLVDFYADQLGTMWEEAVLTSPVRMLADIPLDIVESQMDKFDVLDEEYNKYKFVDL